MLKFYCFVTGDLYSMVVEDTPKSKKKIALMANALLIPVLAWAINGFLLTKNVLGASMLVSLFTSFICAFIIFLIERIIVMSSTNSEMKRFRIILGVCVALLGALALDEVVFKKDIDHQVNLNKAKYAHEEAKKVGLEFDGTNEISARRQSLNQAKHDIGVSEQIAIAEMDGKGSGVKGVGVITRTKLDIVSNKTVAMKREQQFYDSLILEKDSIMTSAKERAMAEYQDGLMIRVKALFQLVFSDWGMGIAYLILTVLMFCIEFIVVLVKSKTSETNYDRRIKLIEKIGQRRMDILEGKDSPLNDSRYCLPHMLAARSDINTNHSVFK